MRLRLKLKWTLRKGLSEPSALQTAGSLTLKNTAVRCRDPAILRITTKHSTDLELEGL